MKIIYTLFFLILTHLTFSQTKHDCVEDVGDKMCVINMDGKYGIIDKKGKFIVPAYFDTIEVHGKGFVVRQKDKCGVIDRKGKILIPIDFANIRCVGNCDQDLIFEITGKGFKSIFISKEQEELSGFKKVTPLLYSSLSEITIGDWFAYLSDVKANGFNYNYGFESVLPDTNKVEEKLKPAYRACIKALYSDKNKQSEKKTYSYYSSWRNDVYYDKSLSDEKKTDMLNFPVTGITHAQATKYCNWLTTIYADKINVNDKLSYNIKFRLPKMEEWETMADAGLNERWRRNKRFDSLDTQFNLRFNYNFLESSKNYDKFINKNYGKGSCSFDYFWSDFNGVYGMYGNVAEMVFENGWAKGGSFLLPAKSAAWDLNISYKEPQPWLGFRVVAELIGK